jgi:23S rRNA (uracil1939-C5)-methyltransferase
MPMTLTPERLVAGGDALARDPDGRVVFIPGALPGEVVNVELTDERRDFARARLVEVLEPSPERVEPPCPNVVRGCGGCSWQHLTPAGQRQARLDIVREALIRQGRLTEPTVESGPELDTVGLRTTMRFGVDAQGHLGLRARNSHEVVRLEECLIAHPRLVELLAPTTAPGADDVQIRVSAATGERLVAWTGRERLTPSGLPADVILGGDGYLYEEVAGVRFRVSATSFFQASPQAAAALVDVVAQAVGPIDPSVTFVDAYGGVGLFSATVGSRAGQVILLESNRDACSDARANLYSGDVRVTNTAVEDWTPRPGTGPGLDGEGRRYVVVADPAREGLGRKGVAALAVLSASRLVLVSCDAAALGRDTRLLAEHGYAHIVSTVLDAFAHSHHVEVVTRFDKTS